MTALTKCHEIRVRLEDALAVERAVSDKMEKALDDIAEIDNQYVGTDWDEIEQARAIARAAIAEVAAIRNLPITPASGDKS